MGFILAWLPLYPAVLAAEEPDRLAESVIEGEPQSHEPMSKAEAWDVYQDCVNGPPGTNAAWAQCGGELMKRADERLNVAWKRAMTELSEVGKAALLDEQRAWLVWRDQSCQVYDSREFGREGQVLTAPVCRAVEIDQRTDQLNSYAEGEHG